MAKELKQKTWDKPYDKPPVIMLRTSSQPGPSRSKPGEGQPVDIYVIGAAEKFADSVISDFNGTAIMGPQRNEDFADCMWPIIVKVKLDVSKEELKKHLKNLIEVYLD